MITNKVVNNNFEISPDQYYSWTINAHTPSRWNNLLDWNKGDPAYKRDGINVNDIVVPDTYSRKPGVLLKQRAPVGGTFYFMRWDFPSTRRFCLLANRLD